MLVGVVNILVGVSLVACRDMYSSGRCPFSQLRVSGRFFMYHCSTIQLECGADGRPPTLEKGSH